MGRKIRKKGKYLIFVMKMEGNKHTTIKLRVNTCMCGPALSFAVTEAPQVPKPMGRMTKRNKPYICNENGGTNEQGAAKVRNNTFMCGTTTHMS